MIKEKRFPPRNLKNCQYVHKGFREDVYKRQVDHREVTGVVDDKGDAAGGHASVPEGVPRVCAEPGAGTVENDDELEDQRRTPDNPDDDVEMCIRDRCGTTAGASRMWKRPGSPCSPPEERNAAAWASPSWRALWIV